MARITDDLGTMTHVHGARRVVSLVPSLTESIVASAAAPSLVGATDWCTHPGTLEVARVRGTKNPDLAGIRALEPDLVIANKEENRELDVRRLRESGVAVWVTDIRTVDAAFASLRRLFVDALDVHVPAWIEEAERAWAEPCVPGPSVAVAIWRDPWMVVGRDTFTGDLLARAGLRNVFAAATDRYPRTSTEQIIAAEPEVILLPDEPYPFSATDGPEALPTARTALIEGRTLTWYGPSLVDARRVLRAVVA